MTLQSVLDGDHAEIRNRVREWLSLPVNAPPYDMPRDQYREWVLENVKALAARGDTVMGFPADYGGHDDVNTFVASFEMLAMGDLSVLVKTGVHFGLFGGAILHLGTKHHHDLYLRDMMSVELPGGFAMTEMGHGSNVAAVETTATYDPETQEFEIHTPTPDARKEYIGNAAQHGQMAAVFAQLIVGGESQGVHALMVPLRDKKGRVAEGVTIEDDGPKLGLDGVDNGRIGFEHVRVPRTALLDRYGSVAEDGTYSSPIENPSKRFFTMLGTLVMGRVSVCGAAVNASKVALVQAVRWSESRRQFGPPDAEEVTLLTYRTQQRRLLPALAATYALHFAQDRLRNELHRVFTATEETEELELDRRKLETFAAGLKAVATWHASDTIQSCREAVGGIGYLSENRFASLRADTDVFTTFEGDNTVLLQLTAKNLLTDYRDNFGDLNPLGVAAFFAGQVIDAIAERTAARELVGRIADELRPNKDEGDLADREYQLGMFRYRQEHLQETAARRLKGGIDAGYDAFEVLVEVQDHVVESGRAWVELVVLESFAAKVEGLAEGSPERELLDKLCTLYAVSRIEAASAFYQEHGRISSPRAKSVIKSLNTLCGELRPHAAELAEGFGVPENVLGAFVRH